MSFFRKQLNTLHHYYIAGSIINVVNEVRDLGITLSSNLSFKNHIDITSAKSFRNVGFIKHDCTDMS